MANIITGFRLLCSIALLFVPTFSMQFYLLYITAGITDVLDGLVARKFNLFTEIGAVFDTTADICFVGVCLFKLIPMLDIPLWLSIWIAVIIFIKAVNIVLGFAVYRTMVSEHTIMNKITGILFFLFPLLLPFISFEIGAFILSAIATASAIQEGYYIKKGKFIN